MGAKFLLSVVVIACSLENLSDFIVRPEVSDWLLSREWVCHSVQLKIILNIEITVICDAMDKYKLNKTLHCIVELLQIINTNPPLYD